VRRDAVARLRFLFVFRAGAVDFGETLHAALHREVDEETAQNRGPSASSGWREVVPTNPSRPYVILSFRCALIRRRSFLTKNSTTSNGFAPYALGDLELSLALPDMLKAVNAAGILA